MPISTKLFILPMAAAFAASAMAQSLTFQGSPTAAVDIVPEVSTGLGHVYVLQSAYGVKATFTSPSGKPATWQKYSNLGGGFAEPVSSVADGAATSITLGSEDMGYIIEDGDKRYYFWITNYANHELSFNSLGFSPDQDCDRSRLTLDGNAKRITYYTINGQPKEISRQLEVSYNTMAYDETTESYVNVETSQQFGYIDREFSVQAPLCDTHFTITGDRFTQAWGYEESAESSLYRAICVEATTTATQEEVEIDNQQKTETDGLGGSAPAEVSFRAFVTDAAIFREWQFATDADFENVTDRYQQLDLDYTFRDQGTTYVRFMAANADGSCEFIGETYEVFIGESALLCPNAFSPGASEGVNDEWKVSYKSLVSFECHIFNTWGQEMISFTDPSLGWDGKYKGKLVPAGAYYYVIKAVGSDGRKYNLSGDINIVNAKKPVGAPSQPTE